MATGARNQQTGRAGEYYVAAELNRRGAYAVTFTGNMPKVDVMASSTDRTRTVFIQVKTCRAGDWQTSTDEGRKCDPIDEESRFWIFVRIDSENEPPEYFIVPDWWMRNNIYEHHQLYLAKHGGKRAVNPKTRHHSIRLKRINEWKNRWDILKIIS
ncbi:MAG: hypothetical protein HN936_14000 [Bacteroidetes bacterium]|jgi:hypothetical protein|nr:hypothetical protein [Bacteroidota bacterium]